jgi:hypothetical protein
VNELAYSLCSAFIVVVAVHSIVYIHSIVECIWTHSIVECIQSSLHLVTMILGLTPTSPWPHLAALGVHNGQNLVVGHILCVVLWSDFGEKDRVRIEGDPARLGWHGHPGWCG